MDFYETKTLQIEANSSFPYSCNVVELTFKQNTGVNWMKTVEGVTTLMHPIIYIKKNSRVANFGYAPLK